MSATPVFDIVCDIGGTNIRFATVDASGRIGESQRFALSAFADFSAAVETFITYACDGAWPSGLAVGVAGPVHRGSVRMTNADWILREADLKTATRDEIAVLVNDLPPVARAVPELAAADFVSLRGARAEPNALEAAIVINVGTGLGAAGLHRLAGTEARWRVVATEAGHIRDPQQTATVAGGADGDALASYEDLVSGQGLAASSAFESAADVFARAGEAAADHRIATFARSLGGAVRDLILAHGAWDGVYLVGSVLQGWLDLWPNEADAPDRAHRSAFFAALDMAGPMSERVAAVPLTRIVAREPALIGLASLLRDARVAGTRAQI